jgi:hypothetical protein
VLKGNLAKVLGDKKLSHQMERRVTPSLVGLARDRQRISLGEVDSRCLRLQKPLSGHFESGDDTFVDDDVSLTREDTQSPSGAHMLQQRVNFL